MLKQLKYNRLHLSTNQSMPKRKRGPMGNDVLTLPLAEESARHGKACTKEDARVFLVSAVGLSNTDKNVEKTWGIRALRSLQIFTRCSRKKVLFYHG